MSRFPCTVDDVGRLVPLHPERTLRMRGRDVWVELHRQAAPLQRSEAGNRYLWSVVYGTIAKETGNDPEAVHYGLKRKALEVGILEPQYILLGDQLVEGEPTTVTDSTVFWDYVAWIRHEAEHGRLTGTPLHLPEPNEPEAI